MANDHSAQSSQSNTSRPTPARNPEELTNLQRAYAEQAATDAAAAKPLIRFGKTADGTHAIGGAADAAAGARPVAVLVCHGMGEQVRYETISSVANAIGAQAQNAGGKLNDMTVHLSRENQDFLARAELTWKDGAGIPREVHVYEAYWAPLTEGRVTYYETIKFLVQAGWRGLCWSKLFRTAEFYRWMFNGKKRLTIGPKTFIGLLVVMAVLLANVALIAYVTLALAQQGKNLGKIPLPGMFGGGFWEFWCAKWDHFKYVLFYDGVPGVVANLCSKVMGHGMQILDFIAWLLLVALALAIRWFLVEYAGDVAAYISPYKDSKFEELRHKIQQVGLDVGKVIYGFDAKSDAVPDYERVVIVGHSLGSVLAYDTLNALLNLDNVSDALDKRHVAHKTRALITMGSPLDKTAFIFRMQPSNEQDWIREQMAASVQPLIVSYKDFRPPTFDWINIWAMTDIVSGELNYYDDPALTPNVAPCVQNHKDPQAKMPIVSHVQYFEHHEFHKWIYKFVT